MNIYKWIIPDNLEVIPNPRWSWSSTDKQLMSGLWSKFYYTPPDCYVIEVFGVDAYGGPMADCYYARKDAS